VLSVGISMSFGLALSLVVIRSLSGVCHPLSPCFIRNIFCVQQERKIPEMTVECLECYSFTRKTIAE
jgi:hypothetical protein